MKRSIKFGVIMAFLFILECWVYLNLDFLYAISLPLMLIALVVLYACADILGSIACMKPNPNENHSLQTDIHRAKSYYRSQSLSFEQ